MGTYVASFSPVIRDFRSRGEIGEATTTNEATTTIASATYDVLAYCCNWL